MDFLFFLGQFFFEALNLTTTTLLLSLVIIFYSLFALSGKVFSADKINNPLIKSVVFSSNGFFTGITGSLIFPGVFFFQALQFNREKLIQALGIHFTFLTLLIINKMDEVEPIFNKAFPGSLEEFILH